MARYALLRLRRGESQAEPVTEVNIIPVIDISLVLLVILFVTAPMLSYPGSPIELPRASAPESAGPTVTVTCTKDLEVSVAASRTEWAAVEDELKARLEREPEAGVVLRVDRAVPYRSVQRLILAAKKAGAKAISLAIDVGGH